MLYEFDSKRPVIDPTAYISDSATIIGEVTIGKYCYVGPNAVIRADLVPIVIGDETVIEDGVIIHAGGRGCKGCYIGNNVTIGHGAIVHGDKLCDGANIGMGAILSMFSVVGENSVVAEGAVVKKNQIVPPRMVVGGSPAKELRELQDKDIEIWTKGNKMYVNLGQKCKDPSIFKRID